jgi:phenylpropionate dioxygenase-like ring-hydroxylating dioxygenase large terminal subunit
MTVTDRHASGVDLGALVEDGRVHRDVYVDPGIFELELDRIFSTTWVYVAHASEIPQPGDYKTTTIGRAPVIVTRAEDGHVHVVYNRCSHRAATVCQDPCGNASYFRCAYHGWTFRNDGSLIGATFSDGYGPDFDKTRFGLTPVARVDSYRGFIFASLAPEGPTLLEHLGHAKEFIDLRCDAAPDGELVLRNGTHRYSYPFNWKLQLENGVDAYHGNFVHQGYFSRIPAMSQVQFATSRSVGVSVDLGNGHALLDSRDDLGDLLGMASGFGPGAEEYRRRLLENVGEDRFAELQRSTGEALNLSVFPNLLLIGVQVRVVFPRAVDYTEIELFPTFLAGAPDEYNEARLRGHEGFYGPAGGGAPDDLEIFRRVATGMAVPEVEWVDLSRGLFRERVEPDGRRVGHVTDEVPQRALYRQWRRHMVDAR